MTGKAILEALSFVDDKYIEEAEVGIIRPALNFKKLLPLAACLCLVLWGLVSGIGVSGKSAAALDETKAELQIVEMEKAESGHYAQNDIALEVEVPYISEVPHVILRIEQWYENGFTAIVEKLGDSAAFEIGQSVQIVFLPNSCVEVEENDLVQVTRKIPTEADFAIGDVVMVRYQFIDDETGVIFADSISLAAD